MRISTLAALLALGCGGSSGPAFERASAGAPPSVVEPAPQPTVVVVVVESRTATGGAVATDDSLASAGVSNEIASAGTPQETGGTLDPQGGAGGDTHLATGGLAVSEAGAPPAATGGLPTATGGAVSTGGLSTGGAADTGGVATGGDAIGGQGSTGGLPTGGAPTGGMPATGGSIATGGSTPTGGASTGGQTSRCDELAAVGLEDGACSGAVVLQCTDGSHTQYSFLLPVYSADEVLASVRVSECAVAEWEQGDGWSENVVAQQGSGIDVYKVEGWECNSPSGHAFAGDVVANNARLYVGCSSGYPEGEGPMSTVLVELSFPE